MTSPTIPYGIAHVGAPIDTKAHQAHQEENTTPRTQTYVLTSIESVTCSITYLPLFARYFPRSK